MKKLQTWDVPTLKKLEAGSEIKTNVTLRLNTSNDFEIGCAGYRAATVISAADEILSPLEDNQITISVTLVRKVERWTLKRQTIGNTKWHWYTEDVEAYSSIQEVYSAEPEITIQQMYPGTYYSAKEETWFAVGFRGSLFKLGPGSKVTKMDVIPSDVAGNPVGFSMEEVPVKIASKSIEQKKRGNV